LETGCELQLVAN